MNITQKYLNKELSTSEQAEYNAWLDSLPEDEYDHKKAVAHAEYLSDSKRDDDMLKVVDEAMNKIFPPF